MALYHVFQFLRNGFKILDFSVSEIIGALISVVAIWVVTGVLVYEAAKRVINRDYEVDGKVMLITASIAVGFNIM